MQQSMHLASGHAVVKWCALTQVALIAKLVTLMVPILVLIWSVVVVAVVACCCSVV